MNRYLVIVVLSTVVLLSCKTTKQNLDLDRNPKWGKAVEASSLKNMYKIDDGVYRSGQPSREDFTLLYRWGITEVLNLRNYYTDKDERDTVNIILYNVKMAAHRINEKDVIQALRLIKNRKGSILIHCKHGSDRTGLVVAMYRIIVQGWSREEAINEMKLGGYGFHGIYKNIIRFINKADVDKISQEINKSS